MAVEHKIIVVREEDADAINTALAAQHESWADTFTVQLNASGLETDPATHRWCSWVMDQADAEFLITLLAGYPESHMYSDTVTTAEDVLTALGLKRMEPEI